ncbi:hypothetical protein SuNHUV7_09210 (plasmid) [Pseudoseohaeicola sp. NH-UV-7]
MIKGTDTMRTKVAPIVRAETWAGVADRICPMPPKSPEKPHVSHEPQASTPAKHPI